MKVSIRFLCGSCLPVSSAGRILEEASAPCPDQLSLLREDQSSTFPFSGEGGPAVELVNWPSSPSSPHDQR